MDTARSERKEKTIEETQLERKVLGRSSRRGVGRRKPDTYELERKDPYIVHGQMAVRCTTDKDMAD